MEVDKELWVPVPSFEGMYEVSSLGRVRSVNRITNDGKKIRGKILSSRSGRYPCVTLYRCNSPVNFSIHRLVAQAFIPNPEHLPEVNHKDGNKLNNSVSNLEWSTSSNNCNHAVVHGLRCASYRVPVKCIETQEVFSSLSAAGRFVHTDATRISESIESMSCCKGYTFIKLDGSVVNEEEYAKNAHSKYQDYHRRPVMPNARRVQCVETGQVFQSISEASQFYSCDTSTISSYALSGRPFKGIHLEFA